MRDALKFRRTTDTLSIELETAAGTLTILGLLVLLNLEINNIAVASIFSCYSAVF
jgi:hypothetical protein